MSITLARQDSLTIYLDGDDIVLSQNPTGDPDSEQLIYLAVDNVDVFVRALRDVAAGYPDHLTDKAPNAPRHE